MQNERGVSLGEKMEKREYKVTISCSVVLEAENVDVARDTAIELWEAWTKNNNVGRM